MKARTLFSLTLAISASLLTRGASPDSRRFVRCAKQEASLSLTLACSLDGVFQDEERVFYFRPPRDGTELEVPEITQTNADGGGGGFGFSATADSRDTVVEVQISTYWTSKSAQGNSALTLATPYFEEKKGKGAGFTYSLVWRKLK